jgi:hypothetical protein
MKLLKAPAVIAGMAHYGYPEHLILALGMFEVGCTMVLSDPADGDPGRNSDYGLFGRCHCNECACVRTLPHRTGPGRNLPLGGSVLA